MANNKKQITPILRKILAIVLIIIGISGIILPVLPGWPFVFWGLFIIGGSALIDRTILKYFPKKFRKKILDWLKSKEKK